MKTNLMDAIDITSEKTRYDSCVKELLSDKQVLAWIPKSYYTTLRIVSFVIGKEWLVLKRTRNPL